MPPTTGLDGKGSACSAGGLGQEDPLEKEMATQSILLAWEIPWAEEPGRPVHGVAELDMTEEITPPPHPHSPFSNHCFQFSTCKSVL